MTSTLEAAIRGHVERLAGDIGERNVFRRFALDASRDYIAEEWRRQGYEVGLHWYEAGGGPCANIEVSRPGDRRPDRVLLVGAHYDTVAGSPGANDNASGVAALLELSRLFVQAVPGVTVRFVAFVNEEPPFFLTRKQGSLAYAREARRRCDDIRLMLSLETMGYYRHEPGSQRYPPLFRLFYPNKGNFVGFVSDLRSRRLMLHLAKLFRGQSDFPLEHVATFRWIPGVAWSDHLSFWHMGFRALMVTDTAFYRYPFYHRGEDRPDALAYPELARVTEGLFNAFHDRIPEDLRQRVTSAQKDVTQAVVQRNADLAAQRLEILKPLLAEVGKAIYAQAPTAGGPQSRPDSGVPGGEAHPTGAGPGGRVVDADFRQAGGPGHPGGYGDVAEDADVIDDLSFFVADLGAS